MTLLWLCFLLGVTAGSVSTWLVSLAPRRSRRTPDLWTVAAITARIERERDQFGRRSALVRPA